MTQSLSSLDLVLVQIILVTLAIGLPVVLVVSIRFLWERKVNLGRSKELEKLIWQLHRIASAMEHQMNLSFPAVQPGTEEARDLAYLQQPAAPPSAAAARVASSSAAAPPVGANQAATQAAATQQPASEEESLPPLERRAPSAEGQRAGVNSMFGL